MPTMAEGSNVPASSIPSLSIPKKVVQPNEPIPRPGIPKKLLSLMKQEKIIPRPTFPKKPPQWSYMDQNESQTSPNTSRKSSYLDIHKTNKWSGTTTPASQGPDYTLHLTPSTSPGSARKQSMELSYRTSAHTSPRRQGAVHVRMFSRDEEK